VFFEGREERVRDGEGEFLREHGGELFTADASQRAHGIL
jgi:hypothetical protein